MSVCRHRWLSCAQEVPRVASSRRLPECSCGPRSVTWIVFGVDELAPETGSAVVVHTPRPPRSRAMRWVQRAVSALYAYAAVVIVMGVTIGAEMSPGQIVYAFEVSAALVAAVVAALVLRYWLVVLVRARSRRRRGQPQSGLSREAQLSEAVLPERQASVELRLGEE